MTRANPLRAPGLRKLAGDSVAVLELHALPMMRQWYLVLLVSVVFPIPMFYVFQAIAPDDAAVWRRLLAGTLIFGVAFNTAMLVGQQVVAQRFLGHLKLLITMPVSKVAYVFGTLAFTSVTGAVSAAVLLGFALLVGGEISPAWALLAAALVLSVFALAGIVLLVMSFAPSLQVGNILASLVAIVLVLVSPVYFTMEAAPLVLRWFGYVSPLRYAADAIAATLSGQTDVWLELGVLAAYALVAMSLGLWRMPWRET